MDSFLLCLVLLSTPADPVVETELAAAEAPPAIPPKPYGWKQLGRDVRFVATRPAHLERRGKIKLAAILGGAAALYLVRDDIREHVQDDRSDLGGWADDARDVFGKGALAPTLAAVLYGTSFATKNEREKEAAFLLLESAALSSVGALGGSFVLAAERPEDGDSIHAFDTDGHGVSLDAALAASIIPPLRRKYLRVRPGDGPWRKTWKRTASTVLYGGALLTAYQRLDTDKHWAPDVYLGLATGLGVGKMLCDAHERSRNGRVSWDLSLSPAGVGVALTLRPLEPSPLALTAGAPQRRTTGGRGDP